MSEQTTTCSVCGARLEDDQACIAYFHLLLGWELDYGLYDVHHLLVLGYSLQHPASYSPECLPQAIGQLVDFVENDVTPAQMRKRIAAAVASDARRYKITGTPTHHGTYAYPVDWPICVDAIVRAGPDVYYASVRAWANSVLAALRQSGNLPGRGR